MEETGWTKSQKHNLSMTFWGTGGMSSVTGTLDHEGVPEEKSGKALVPETTSTERHARTSGPEPVRGPWRFSLGLCSGASSGQTQHMN